MSFRRATLELLFSFFLFLFLSVSELSLPRHTPYRFRYSIFEDIPRPSRIRIQERARKLSRGTAPRRERGSIENAA
jgi:hypothetical protein